MNDKKEYNREEELDKKKETLQERRGKVRRIYYLSLACGIIFISIALGQLASDILLEGGGYIWPLESDMLKPLCLILLIYGVMMICAVAPMSRSRLRTVEEEIQDIEFEKDLLRLTTIPAESRAEKLLKINQYQLRRYYDLNLSQSSWIFAVGIMCILLGAGILGVTLYLIASPRLPGESLGLEGGSQPQEGFEFEEKIVLGFLGAVGTILTEYVAAIYLKMHSSITESLVAFHSKLVSINKLFLANLIASRIENSEKREDTFAKLALSIIGSEKE